MTWARSVSTLEIGFLELRQQGDERLVQARLHLGMQLGKLLLDLAGERRHFVVDGRFQADVGDYGQRHVQSALGGFVGVGRQAGRDEAGGQRQPCGRQAGKHAFSSLQRFREFPLRSPPR